MALVQLFLSLIPGPPPRRSLPEVYRRPPSNTLSRFFLITWRVLTAGVRVRPRELLVGDRPLFFPFLLDTPMACRRGFLKFGGSKEALPVTMRGCWSLLLLLLEEDSPSSSLVPLPLSFISADYVSELELEYSR